MQVDSNAFVYVQKLSAGNSAGTSTFTQNGGSVTAKQWFVMGQNAGYYGIANLNGGSFVFDASAGAYNAQVGAGGTEKNGSFPLWEACSWRRILS